MELKISLRLALYSSELRYSLIVSSSASLSLALGTALTIGPLLRLLALSELQAVLVGETECEDGVFFCGDGEMKGGLAMAAMLDLGVLCKFSDVELGRRPFLEVWTGDSASGLDLDRFGADRLVLDGDAASE